jgi:ribose transport system ATP-binding protein
VCDALGCHIKIDRVTKVSSFALELLGITKIYGTTEVLHGIDLRVQPGSIHALLGANGAGKSTLLKIAVGATPPSAGRILLNGQERHFSSPLEARRLGIGMVFQERSLVPDLSVIDNIFLNGEIKRAGLVQLREQVTEARRIFQRLGITISPTARISQLSIADQQMVEIAKALRLASKVLILDEPTAALTEREVQRLFIVLRQIAKSGVGIVYVSHRLAEMFDVCDRATVIRDGRVVLSTSMADTNMRQIVEAIAGGALQNMPPAAKEEFETAQLRDRPPVLAVRDLEVGLKLRNISFEVRPGEILGIAGLAGSGRSTLLKSLFGLIHRHAGSISIAGRNVNPSTPGKAISNGLYLIPEDRKTQGLVLSHSIEANLVVSILKRITKGLLVSAGRSAEVAVQTIAQLRIQPNDRSLSVEWLSGGNQQKVVLGKAFNAHGNVLLLDEPTFGVDVRSRAEISTRIREFADKGNGVVWVTSDLRELREVADRILILADGKVRDIVSNRPQRRSESEITHLIQTAAAR